MKTRLDVYYSAHSWRYAVVRAGRLGGVVDTVHTGWGRTAPEARRAGELAVARLKEGAA